MSVEIDFNTGSVKLKSELRKNILCMRNDEKNFNKKNILHIPEFKKFTREDLFFNSIPNGSERFFKKLNPFEGEGNPQMCLLLPEIYFLVKCVPKNIDGTVLYLGAHPGDHINFLASFFPNLHFKVYDYSMTIPEEKIMAKIGDDPYQDEEGKQIPLKNIEKIKQFFTVEEAKKIAEIKKSNSSHYKNIFVISDIRNKNYNRVGSIDKNSQMLDEDTFFQIEVCRIMQPNAALLKYRPKLKEERITIPFNLTIEEKLEESRKLYYMYPEGIFLKLPMQKKTQKAMYFICNNYELTKKYYHDDMIKMIDYHHGYERRAILFDNPFDDEFGMETACLGRDDVKNIIDKISNDDDHLSYEDYCFGCGWDARASVYIIISYLCYLKGDSKIINKSFGISKSLKEIISTYLIYPFVHMKKNKEIKKEEEKSVE